MVLSGLGPFSFSSSGFRVFVWSFRVWGLFLFLPQALGFFYGPFGFGAFFFFFLRL